MHMSIVLRPLCFTIPSSTPRRFETDAPRRGHEFPKHSFEAFAQLQMVLQHVIHFPTIIGFHIKLWTAWRIIRGLSNRQDERPFAGS